MADIHWSIFGSKAADRILRTDGEWPELVTSIYHSGPHQDKNSCPWVKMAKFGDKRSVHNSLRHDGNVVEIFGVEGDYDGEVVQPEDAIAKLEAAQIKAAIYTSPSHTADKPRWRVLAPLSEATSPEARYALLARINGVLGGILSGESFTLSQSYYFGRVQGVEYKVLVTFDDPTEGNFIDLLPELDDLAIGKPVAPKHSKHQDEDSDRWKQGELAEMTARLGRKLRTGDGRHLALVRAANSLSAQGFRDVGAVVLMLEALVQKYFDSSDPPATGALLSIAEHAVSRDLKNQQNAAAMVSGLMAELRLPESVPADTVKVLVPTVVPMPDGLLRPPGVLGEVTDWVNATSSKPQPMFAVQAALAFGCAVLGRRFATTQHNWPTLYLLNIGKSASGKEHAKWAVEHLLEACGMDQLIGPSSYTSGAGVLSALHSQPSHLTVIDEFGKELERASVKNDTRMKDMLKTLIEAWGRCHGVIRPAGYSTFGMSQKDAESMQQRTIRNPALSMLAMTTPETFFDTIGSAAARDGFLNRFLIVESDIGRQVRSPHAHHAPVPDSVTGWAKGVHARSEGVVGHMASVSPTPVLVGLSGDAMRLFAAFDADCLTRMDDNEVHGLAEMFGRSNEMAMRVALILAVGCATGDGEIVISSAHAKWAIDYVGYHADRTVARLVSSMHDSEFEATQQQVMQSLISAGQKGRTNREIHAHCRKVRSLSKRQQVELMESLAFVGKVKLVKFDTSSGRGKPREAWVAIDEDEITADKTQT